MPNTVSTPWATRVSTRTSETVRARSRLRGQPDVDPVRAVVDVVRRDGIGEAFRGEAGQRVVVVAVPRAPQPAVLDRPLADRSALVGAAVLQRAEPAAAPGQRHRPAVHDGAPDSAFVGHVGLLDAVPRRLLFCPVDHGVTPFRLTRLCLYRPRWDPIRYGGSDGRSRGHPPVAARRRRAAAGRSAARRERHHPAGTKRRRLRDGRRAERPGRGRSDLARRPVGRVGRSHRDGRRRGPRPRRPRTCGSLPGRLRGRGRRPPCGWTRPPPTRSPLPSIGAPKP